MPWKVAMPVRELKFLVIGFGVWALVGFVPRVQAAGPHYVFAHYMVCFPTYGATIAGFEQEIREAQAAGIDGFALDEGVYDDPTQPYYNSNIALMYSAAEQLNTGFKLFFSVEVTNAASIVDMISTYAARTNTFRQGGNVVVSTFGQNGTDWLKSVFIPLKSKGISVFFIPYFWPNPITELPSYQDGVNILNTYSSLLNGLFYFGAAGLPAQLSACNSNYTLAAHQAGKIFMASVTPHYWGCNQPATGRRYFEFDGGEGTVSQWQSIITNQPDWVEITTWNDFNESTYISPVINPGQYEQQVQIPARYCHSGFLNLSQPYITWYKTGQQPALTNDELFYSYRIHSTNLVASDTNDTPVTTFFGDIADVIYNTVFLTAPAQLEILSGTNSVTKTLGAGLQQLRTPFAPGAQTFILLRSGVQVLSAEGPPILSQIQRYDYFPASGLACQPPPSPPTGLQVVPVSGTN
jgi:glucan endo-1,3-alpha-glucosidase